MATVVKLFHADNGTESTHHRVATLPDTARWLKPGVTFKQWGAPRPLSYYPA